MFDWGRIYVSATFLQILTYLPWSWTHTYQNDVGTKPGRIWTQSHYWRNATGGCALGFRAGDRNSHMTAQEVKEQTDSASGCPLRLSHAVRLKCPGVRSCTVRCRLAVEVKYQRRNQRYRRSLCWLETSDMIACDSGPYVYGEFM